MIVSYTIVLHSAAGSLYLVNTSASTKTKFPIEGTVSFAAYRFWLRAMEPRSVIDFIVGLGSSLKVSSQLVLERLTFVCHRKWNFALL